MISLSGSTRASAGSLYCVTATNVQNGLSAKAYVAGQSVAVTVTYDSSTHTATICVKVPRGIKGGVEILATDSNTPSYVSHSALITGS